MLDFFDLQVAQNAGTAVRETQRENGARWGVSSHTLATKGTTSLRVGDPLIFEMPFIAPPAIATGVAILKDYDPTSGWMPRVSTGVWQWHRNVKGHYTGAYVYIRVDGVLNSELQHHFTFSGTAYKDLGQEATTEAETLTVRPVGFGGI
jgi:hypothetical protein